MFTPTPIQHRSRKLRGGFTLIELLAAIAVIAILAGILVPVIFGAVVSAREFAITNEVQNMERQIEDFKTKYGFYPPTIGLGMEVDSAFAMRPYLIKISNTHAEGDGSPSSRLGVWWTNVGSKMDARSSLVFWLSGICKNKQFPLSGASGATTALAPFNGSFYWDGSPVPAAINIEREVRFDFEKNRLVQLPSAANDQIYAYNQPYGTGDDLAYRYVDFRSYVAVGAYAIPTISGFEYVNPNKFQLIGPGMDGLINQANDPVPPAPRIFNALGSAHDDNIVNFGPGRFEVFVADNE